MESPGKGKQTARAGDPRTSAGQETWRRARSKHTGQNNTHRQGRGPKNPHRTRARRSAHGSDGAVGGVGSARLHAPVWSSSSVRRKFIRICARYRFIRHASTAFVRVVCVHTAKHIFALAFVHTRNNCIRSTVLQVLKGVVSCRRALEGEKELAETEQGLAETQRELTETSGN